ncbi:MAG: Valine--tRNA ligase [Chlamydiia bacterium]|nr:Valine--tRNA ligase [Chlamydiia bacterium]
MSELNKVYDPSSVENKWAEAWEKKKLFVADCQSSKPGFSVIMPPPNVTGVLHAGHGLVMTLQDIVCRKMRMSGSEVLWQPGTDHAGIATQTVVESHLRKTTGKRRTDFERKEFIEHVWDWKEKSQGRILEQMQKLGVSADWSRLRFTMDEGSTKAVMHTFKKMFDEKLIYRGDYLVNWDTVTRTALADDEVEHEEADTFLWYFTYPVDNTKETITIATTRPETMFGDVAVAVNPKDTRYTPLIGQYVKHPMTERLIPIIVDDFVKPEFGTGAVKITPAHDFNDYEMGRRHDLMMINMMNEDGTINENGGEFAGLTMAEGREKVVARMREKGFLEKIKPHTHRRGISYRSKAVIEPKLSLQWFIDMKPFKEKMRLAVESGRVEVIPKKWEKTYYHWIDNLKDWCISRQLWWGHRIPVWYSKKDPTKMFCCIDGNFPEEMVANMDEYVQDEDVLDTWFSSALWPFSSMGWPDEEECLDKFYPTSLLITGYDILFFWIARMIMMGDYIMGDVPFKKTFINGLIFGKSYWRVGAEGHISYLSADERLKYELGEKLPKDVHAKWEKMSKSKGNIIDPIEMIDQYGADATRLALASSISDSSQIDLDRKKFEEFRNFSNKMWNATRFILMNLDGLTGEIFAEGIAHDRLTLADRWILSRLETTVQNCGMGLDQYEFATSAKEIYRFYWDDFCSNYIEMSKPYLFGKVGDETQAQDKKRLLVIVLLTTIRLLHPITPYITEELFSHLKEAIPGLVDAQSDEPYAKSALEALRAVACAVAPYPVVVNADTIDPSVESKFQQVEEVIFGLRQIRADQSIAPSTMIDVAISGPDIGDEARAMIQSLVRINTITLLGADEPAPAPASKAVLKEHTLYVPLAPEKAEEEKKRLTVELEKSSKHLASFKNKLANSSFIEKAPKQLVSDTHNKVSELEEKIAALQEGLRALS